MYVRSLNSFFCTENKNMPWILVTCSNCTCGGDGRGSLPVDTAKIGKVCNIYGKNFTHFDGSWETYLFCYGLTATSYLMHNGLNVLKLLWFMCLRCTIIWIYWRKNNYSIPFFVFWSTLTKKQKIAVIFRQNADFLYRWFFRFWSIWPKNEKRNEHFRGIQMKNPVAVELI